MHNKYLTFLIDSVAVYRLTKIILDDKITEDLRAKIWKKFPPQTTKTGFMLTCPWCVSIWAAGAIFTTRAIDPVAADFISSVLASSALTGVGFENGL